MTETSIAKKLNQLKKKVNTTGHKIIGSTLLTLSMLSLSQKAQGTNNYQDDNFTRQDIKEQSLDNKDCSHLLREEIGDTNKKTWTHTVDMGDGYFVMESSVTLSGKEGDERKNMRMLVQPDGETVSLDFLEMNKFMTPSEQKIGSSGSIEETFDNGFSRVQAEKENLKTLTLMKKQLDERLDKTASDHAFSYVKRCLNEQMNPLGVQKASIVSNQMMARKTGSRR